MTSQAISGDFAKVSNFTEPKNLTLLKIVFHLREAMFMVIDSHVWNTSLSNFMMFINLIKFQVKGFQSLNVSEN